MRCDERLRRLIQARIKLEVTQQEVAYRMGTSQSNVSKMEREVLDGIHIPTEQWVRRYHEALDAIVGVMRVNVVLRRMA